LSFKKGVIHGQESKESREKENEESCQEIQLRLLLPLTAFIQPRRLDLFNLRG
jgi:hypothetical protein